MGFLTGMYGMLSAGKYYRQLQNELTDIQSQLRRATRQATDMQNQINQQYRMQKNCMTSQMTMQNFAAQQGGYAPNISQFYDQAGLAKFAGESDTAAYVSKGADNNYTLTEKGQSALNNLNYQQQQYLQSVNMQSSGMQQMASSNLDNWKEMMEQMMLQPLKDLEDDLSTQKDAKEAEMKMAEQDYQAKKEEVKDGAKNAAPQYTGSGQG